MNTKFEYIHISSLDREITKSTDDAVLNINLSGHPIKHIKQVAVKSFSINNSFFNITSQRNTMSFVMTKLGSDSVYSNKLFSIQLPLGYYNNKDLVDLTSAGVSGIINQLLITLKDETGFKVGTESNNHTIDFSFDPDSFKMAISGVAGSGTSFSNIWITPLREKGEDLYNALGFTHDQTVPIEEFSNTSTASQFYESFSAQSFELHPSTASVSVKELPIVVANQSTSMENIQGIYLTSNALVNGGTYESSLTGGHLRARPKNILEFVQFDGAHYSTISYKPDILHHHYLNGKEINNIDLGITNVNGELYKWNEIGHYHIVLVFECLIQDEISGEFNRLYNREGYARAHEPDKIIYGKFK
jgi:hypothetical protein